MSEERYAAIRRAGRTILDDDVVEIRRVPDKRRHSPWIRFEGNDPAGRPSHFPGVNTEVGSQIDACLAPGPVKRRLEPCRGRLPEELAAVPCPHLSRQAPEQPVDWQPVHSSSPAFRNNTHDITAFRCNAPRTRSCEGHCALRCFAPAESRRHDNTWPAISVFLPLMHGTSGAARNNTVFARSTKGATGKGFPRPWGTTCRTPGLFRRMPPRAILLPGRAGTASASFRTRGETKTGTARPKRSCRSRPAGSAAASGTRTRLHGASNGRMGGLTAPQRNSPCPAQWNGAGTCPS